MKGFWITLALCLTAQTALAGDPASCQRNPWELKLPDFLNGVPLFFSNALVCKGSCLDLQANPLCKELLQSPDTGKAEARLRSYCQPRIPNNAREAFLPQYDVPALIISDWSRQHLESQWQGSESRLSQSYPHAPAESVYRLNLEAERLWTLMVSCHLGDEEIARHSYYQARFDCSRSEVSGTTLVSQIARFLSNVEDFFATTSFPQAFPSCMDPMSIAQTIVNRGPQFQSSASPFPALHPLFVQASMQALLKQVPIGESISMKRFVQRLDHGVQRLNFFNSLSQISTWIPNAACSTYGLWPSAGRSVIRALTDTSLKLLVTVPEIGNMIRLKETDYLATGCTSELLPVFYVKEENEIALEMRGISKKYDPRRGP